MQLQKNLLTKQGYAKIKEEFNLLKNNRKTKFAKEAPSAMASGEANSDYITYCEDLNLIEIRLIKLAEILKNSVIVKGPEHQERGIVSVGATVKVENGGQVGKFKIVGSVEADPAGGRISCTSPVGSALIGHRAGDKIIVESPLKALYRILSVEYQMA